MCLMYQAFVAGFGAAEGAPETCRLREACSRMYIYTTTIIHVLVVFIYFIYMTILYLVCKLDYVLVLYLPVARPTLLNRESLYNFEQYAS